MSREIDNSILYLCIERGCMCAMSCLISHILVVGIALSETLILKNKKYFENDTASIQTIYNLFLCQILRDSVRLTDYNVVKSCLIGCLIFVDRWLVLSVYFTVSLLFSF